MESMSQWESASDRLRADIVYATVFNLERIDFMFMSMPGR
ncbi:uncharacterized protein RSE6_09908 [Rhynchosporium secalis]|uniref:Uncharacterized protein n=1 Tax=Rhynchosporium secalis TaxID=38038 RepID=A0A1E1MJ43_RHYSE|nr:uncharacterized protein RSE6_09908 [Rhynchosporium secalis]